MLMLLMANFFGGEEFDVKLVGVIYAIRFSFNPPIIFFGVGSIKISLQLGIQSNYIKGNLSGMRSFQSGFCRCRSLNKVRSCFFYQGNFPGLAPRQTSPRMKDGPPPSSSPSSSSVLPRPVELCGPRPQANQDPALPHKRESKF